MTIKFIFIANQTWRWYIITQHTMSHIIMKARFLRARFLRARFLRARFLSFTHIWCISWKTEVISLWALKFQTSSKNIWKYLKNFKNYPNSPYWIFSDYESDYRVKWKNLFTKLVVFPKLFAPARKEKAHKPMISVLKAMQKKFKN